MDATYKISLYNRMTMIKIINSRLGGSLFHYAHFICDCLYVEIINDIFKYDKVVRIKNLAQTLGNFKEIYEEVMGNQSIEVSEEIFNNNPIKSITLRCKESYDLNDMNKFRKFIFARYMINPAIYNSNYPEIVLIKRGKRKELINDIDAWLLEIQKSEFDESVKEFLISTFMEINNLLKKYYKP
jgi:hypothetical protein